jgi:hypothetical protein
MNNLFLTPDEIRGYLKDDRRVIQVLTPLAIHFFNGKDELLKLRTRKFSTEEEFKEFLLQFDKDEVFYVNVPDEEVYDTLIIEGDKPQHPFWKMLRMAHAKEDNSFLQIRNKLLDFENKAAEAMDNGVDDERWKPGEDALTALIRERDFYRSKYNSLTKGNKDAK